MYNFNHIRNYIKANSIINCLTFFVRKLVFSIVSLSIEERSYRTSTGLRQLELGWMGVEGKFIVMSYNNSTLACCNINYIIS